MAERWFQFGVAHAAPLPTGRSRTFCDAVEVSMDPRAKSIAFACSGHVLQSDTAVTRVDAVPQPPPRTKLSALAAGSSGRRSSASCTVQHPAFQVFSRFFRSLYRRRARRLGTFQAADRRQVCSAEAWWKSARRGGAAGRTGVLRPYRRAPLVECVVTDQEFVPGDRRFTYRVVRRTRRSAASRIVQPCTFKWFQIFSGAAYRRRARRTRRFLSRPTHVFWCVLEACEGVDL